MQLIRNHPPLRRSAAFLRNWWTGLNQPFPFAGLVLLPRFLASWRRYVRNAPGSHVALIDTHPCLNDRIAATPYDPHYFHQAAWLSRCLRTDRPELHVDIGSSVMSVGVLSGFVNTVFVDYRPLTVRLPGLWPVGADMTALPFADRSIASLSCLHVLEHIGLGRYGDALDANGSCKAAAELVRVLRPGGRLYLSVPVGRERVCFNAHRVFLPYTVAEMLRPLQLASFALVTDAGELVTSASMDAAARCEYGCGLFEFAR